MLILPKKSNIMKINNYKKFIAIYSMGKEVIVCDNNEAEKHKFLQYKKPNLMNDVDISEIVVFNKVSFGKKGF